MAESPERGPIVLMTPVGRKLDHDLTLELAAQPRLVVIAGHYEGVDARVHEHLATHEVSIGDYVLSGGELPAMVLVDAVVRHIPGALGSPDSAGDESFVGGSLEAPPYTRPAEFRGLTVPEVLLSGNHQEVARWRRRQSLLLTAERRPLKALALKISSILGSSLRRGRGRDSLLLIPEQDNRRRFPRHPSERIHRIGR